MSTKVLTISEDEFHVKYKPIDNPFDPNAAWDGKMLETFGEELQHCFNLAQKENRVWTIIECDEVNEEDITDDVEYNPKDEDDDDYQPPCLYIISGFHYVNRQGFLITEVPYEQEIEVKIEW